MELLNSITKSLNTREYCPKNDFSCMKIIFNFKFYDLLSHVYEWNKDFFRPCLKNFNSTDFLEKVLVDTLHQMRSKRTMKDDVGPRNQRT